ncbi:PREDICTED: programmed cell death protein 1 [Chrysochloris asiatica]|uniref:Programmed cell death protein 1 n=1 Tax=Chrysochloris asiatica TaxID=185453 RepID=A0A9B0U8A1_CHRAS|nr:PREDICTED: programmed cell death protein 1 [Chrysochloris asiatica]
MRAPRAPWPLVWAVLQLGWRPGWLQGRSDRSAGEKMQGRVTEVCPERAGSTLTFGPTLLKVSEGKKATFHCNVPNTTASTVLNWYGSSPSNQWVKIASFHKNHSQSAWGPRFSITKLGDGHTFHLHISSVLHNDSNTYYCGAIDLPPKPKITESPCAELMVTDRVSEPATINPSPLPGTLGQLRILVVSVTSVLVGILVLLLLAWLLVTVLPREAQGFSTGADRAQSDDKTLVSPLPLLPVTTAPHMPGSKEDPSPIPVFTVDYGELDFEQREKTPEPPVTFFPVQTEYATIVFPGGVSPSDRRGSTHGLQGSRPLWPEDTHCSWPL